MIDTLYDSARKHDRSKNVRLKRCLAACSTSPRRGEVGARSAPGEGGRVSREIVPPHPNPLPSGERERTEIAESLANYS